MLVKNGEVDGVRLLSPESVQLLRRDWLNDFSEPRRQPLWVWDSPGIGFSPLGQLGVPASGAVPRQTAGARLDTVHWGGAGGSGYMLTLGRKTSGFTSSFSNCLTSCFTSCFTSCVYWSSPFRCHRNWERQLVVLTYTGCVFDTNTQKADSSQLDSEP